MGFGLFSSVACGLDGTEAGVHGDKGKAPSFNGVVILMGIGRETSGKMS